MKIEMDLPLEKIAEDIKKYLDGSDRYHGDFITNAITRVMNDSVRSMLDDLIKLEFDKEENKVMIVKLVKNAIAEFDAQKTINDVIEQAKWSRGRYR